MTGWRLLGDGWITGEFARGVIRVGRYVGRVARVMLVVIDSNLDVGDVVVQFGNGQRWSPGLRHSFADEYAAARSIFQATSASSAASSWFAGPCRRAARAPSLGPVGDRGPSRRQRTST